MVLRCFYFLFGTDDSQATQEQLPEDGDIIKEKKRRKDKRTTSERKRAKKEKSATASTETDWLQISNISWLLFFSFFINLMFDESLHNVNMIIIKNETLLFDAFLRLLHWNLFGQWRTSIFFKAALLYEFFTRVVRLNSQCIDSQVYVNKDGLTKTETKDNNNHR